MKLTKAQFTEKLSLGNLAITLIGMSNIGKSTWSRRLSKINFHHIEFDKILAEKLQMPDLAKWLGQPYDRQFPKNQQTLLDLESSTLNEILNQKFNQNTIIDTPGSIIYCEKSQSLKEKSLVIYIEATPEMKEAMFEVFLKHPKPIIWGDKFENHEDNYQALKNSYPKLLAHRSKLYEELADITIPYLDIETRDTTDFLNKIHETL